MSRIKILFSRRTILIFLAIASVTGLIIAALFLFVFKPWVYSLPAERAARFVPGELIIIFKPDVSEAEKAELHQRFGATVIDQIPELNSYLISLPADLRVENAVKLYRAQSIVESAEANFEAYPHNVVPNDPFWRYQWTLPRLGLPEVWNRVARQGKSEAVLNDQVVVAVLDSGVDASHPDLIGRVLPGWNTRHNNANTSDGHWGHGTAAAGLIAAIMNNHQGIVGHAAGTRILPVRISDAVSTMDAVWRDGVSTFWHVAKGTVWATNNGARVINVSWGSFCDPFCWLIARDGPSVIRRAVDFAWNRNAVVVAAMGNIDLPFAYRNFPAAIERTIAVGATDRNDRRARWNGCFIDWQILFIRIRLFCGASTWGPWIDVAAPGDNLHTTAPPGSPTYRGWGGYKNYYVSHFGGTSGATPIVSSLAALLISAHPAITPAEITRIIRETSRDIERRGFDPYTGFGLVQFDKALRAVWPCVTQDGDRNIAKPCDLTPPIISRINMANSAGAPSDFTNIRPGQPITFTWTTNEPSTGEIIVERQTGTQPRSPNVTQYVRDHILTAGPFREGFHSFRIRARDRAGNIAESQPVRFLVGQPPPLPELPQLPAIPVPPVNLSATESTINVFAGDRSTTLTWELTTPADACLAQCDAGNCAGWVFPAPPPHPGGGSRVVYPTSSRTVYRITCFRNGLPIGSDTTTVNVARIQWREAVPN